MVALIAFPVDTLNPKVVYDKSEWVSGRWISHSGITAANDLIEKELPGQLRSVFSLERHSFLEFESDKFGTCVLGFVSPPSELEWIPSVVTITLLESKALSSTFLEDVAALRKEGKEKLQKLGIDTTVIFESSRALVFTNDAMFKENDFKFPIYRDAKDFEVHTKILTSLIVLVFQETSVALVSEMASSVVGRYKSGRKFTNDVSMVSYFFWWPDIMKNLASDSVYKKVRNRTGLAARIDQLKEFSDRLQNDLSLVEKRRTANFMAAIATLGFLIAVAGFLEQMQLLNFLK